MTDFTRELAAPRLRREGVPVGNVLEDPERRLYELLERTEGIRRMHDTTPGYGGSSPADACRLARVDR